MKLRFVLTILMSLFLSPALAHKGKVNSEGCHKNTHNDVYHCHRGRGTVISLPSKGEMVEDTKIHIPKEYRQKRSIATIKKTMSDSQNRLLELECCVGANYLSKATCKAFGYSNWQKKKDCARQPANLEYDLSINLLSKIRCLECCTGEELLGNNYCKDRGFDNWNRGKACGCNKKK